MNNSLEKVSIVEKEKLCAEFYFQSLLEQGCIKGLVSERDIERLQYECLAFLAHMTALYNGGVSSSIRVEKAQDIMTSNMFTISLWLKTYKNPDDAIKAIQNEQIASLYLKGRKRIDTLIWATKSIHAKLLHQLIDSPNVFYRSTIEGGVLGFFKLYHPDFSAHEIHITADYPLYNFIPKLAGIEFIKAYVESAYYENMFCSYFAPHVIHQLLCGYEEDYQELLINIYEQVLTAAIGCILAGKDVYMLDMSEDAIVYLDRFFTGMIKSDILTVIQTAAHKLNCIFNFTHGLELYINKSLSNIANKIEITLNHEQSLKNVFYKPCSPEHK